MHEIADQRTSKLRSIGMPLELLESEPELLASAQRSVVRVYTREAPACVPEDRRQRPRPDGLVDSCGLEVFKC